MPQEAPTSISRSSSPKLGREEDKGVWI